MRLASPVKVGGCRRLLPWSLVTVACYPVALTCGRLEQVQPSPFFPCWDGNEQRLETGHFMGRP